MQKRYTKTVLSLLALLVFMFGATGSVWAQVNLRIGDVTGTAGDSIEIPVTASDLTADQVTSYQFSVSYNADVLSITDASVQGTLSADGSLEFNPANGEARVAFAGDQPLAGSGTLVVLKGVLNSVGDSPLTLSDARLFDQQAQDVDVTTSNGSLASGIGVTLPDAVGLLSGDQTIQVPVEVDDLTDQNITAYQFTVSYDPSIINVTGVTGDGSLSSDGSLDASASTGSINVAFASSNALEGSGDLLFLEVELLSEGTTPLTFDSFAFFNAAGDEVNNSASGGSVTAAPPARAQIIHNAADPAADPVDIYVNGELPEPLNDFAFRSATPFLDLPAGVELNIGVAPGNSESAADTLANFPLTLQDDQTYTVVASGVLNPADFAANPDGASTGFTLFVAPNAQEAASGSGSVALRAVHGATDAPTVDIIQVAGATLLDDVSYGAISPYLPASPEATVVTVAPGSGGSPVAAFEVNLSGAGGSAVTVLASGFLNPSNNQDGPPFRLVGVFPDGSVEVLQPLAFPQDVSVSINQSFEDATDQSNYALVGLPGQVDLSIASTLEGESPDNWRAFWDNGSASVDDGLVEFDGSNTFNFRPGRGFWLLSENPWAVSNTFSPISLNADGTGSISLHTGWNIISNPFGKTIPWGAVQSANGASQDLWQWSGSFSTLTSFASASNGEAFYFLNDGGLNQLNIPFFFPSGSAAVASSKATDAQQLTLTAFQNGERVSAVRAGLSGDAAEGRDTFDQFAPPAHFDAASMHLKNDQVQSDYAKGLAADFRPTSATGQRFEIELSATPGEVVTFEAAGLDQFAGQEVRLINTSNSVSFNLHEKSTVTVRPEAETSGLVLLVGSSEFVEEQQSEVVPDQIKLLPNYPNPFRGQTTLRFALPEQDDVRLVIYDVLGRTVRTLVSEQKQSGVHSVNWNGRNDAGQPVASGLYLGRLEVGETTQTTKLLLVK